MEIWRDGLVCAFLEKSHDELKLVFVDDNVGRLHCVWWWMEFGLFSFGFRTSGMECTGEHGTSCTARAGACTRAFALCSDVVPPEPVGIALIEEICERAREPTDARFIEGIGEAKMSHRVLVLCGRIEVVIVCDKTSGIWGWDIRIPFTGEGRLDL